MAKKVVHVVPLKRRRLGETNYRRRMRLLAAHKPRAVIRISNKNIYIQLVEFAPQGDKVMLACNAGMLSKLGWKYSPANIAGAYLVGLFTGRKAVEKKITAVVVDAGLRRITKSNRIFAAIKGLREAGIKIAVAEGMLPDDHQVHGKHIAAYAKKLKDKDVAQYQKLFSGYLKSGAAPEDMPKNVDEVKKEILAK